MAIEIPTALLCRAKPLHSTGTSDEWVYGYYYPGFGKVQYLLQVQKVPDDFWQYATDADDWHRDVEMMVWVSIRSETLGRFTGLLDKNKKKIYEGDIVKHGFTNHLGDFYENGVVIFVVRNGSYEILTDELYSKRLTFLNIKKLNIEIVGAIND